MKRWTKWLLAVLAMLCVLATLVWFLPARWVMPAVEARLHGTRLKGVGGLLWDGHADQVVGADGTALGRLQWQLSRRALIGTLQLHARIDGPAVDANGDLARDGKDMLWRNVQMHVRLDALPQPLATPWGTPGGELALQLDHARLVAGWPMTLAASAQWSQASLGLGPETVALGRIVADATASNGVIGVRLHDGGQGPLHLDGTLQASPLGWRLAADLQARHDDPALRRWLARFGPADANGIVHIRHGAGLGATSLSSGAP